ncbi:hypothetical protein DL96DRAFT_1706442 [Flagelloscypha sp. PMI_526]|nr:hypothetical protein DL96DRAFT_1706442 [Flagelloscypha sp. PMI_526]
MAALLSSDICHEILNYLPSLSLRTCTLVNSSFRDIAQPKFFSHITLRLRSGKKLQATYCWFRYSPRGIALCREVRHLALISHKRKDISQHEAQQVLRLVQLFSPSLRTLELRGEQQWNQRFKKTLMRGLRLYVLPIIQKLIVWGGVVSLFEILGCCTAL